MAVTSIYSDDHDGFTFISMSDDQQEALVDLCNQLGVTLVTKIFDEDEGTLKASVSIDGRVYSDLEFFYQDESFFSYNYE